MNGVSVHALVAADDAAQREVLEALVKHVGPGLVGDLLHDLALEGGDRLREMRGAAIAGDAAAMHAAAHSLKGMSRTLGFERLGAACESLEKGGVAEPREVEAVLDGMEEEMRRVERLRDAWAAG